MTDNRKNAADPDAFDWEPADGEEMVYGADPRPIPRAVSVSAGYPILHVAWNDGGGDAVDLSGWIALNHLSSLTDRDLFARPSIADYGLTVRWGDSEDAPSVSTYFLSSIAERQRPFAAADIQAWQKRLRLSSREAAAALGVGLSTWHTYKRGEAKIPTTLAIACRAMEADPAMLAAQFKPSAPVGRPAAV